MDYLSKEEREALEKFTRGVKFLLGDNLLILKLFGSKARGDFSDESDKEEKSKCRWGIPPKSDQQYFEILCLCVLQAGLSWGMVRKNWRKAEGD